MHMRASSAARDVEAEREGGSSLITFCECLKYNQMPDTVD
jgi:hypothetical protein